MTPRSRRDLITIAILWVVLAGIAEFLSSYVIESFPGTLSKQGVVTSDAIFFLVRVADPVLILVALIIIFAAIRFRVPDNDTKESEHQYRGAAAFPWGWVAVSVVLNVLFIFHPGISGLEAIWSMEAAATNPLEVDVTASQWAWTFSYPEHKLSGVKELVVPVNRPVKFVLNSNDVMHSFWVPAWGIKKAVIPGEQRTLFITPDEIVSTEANPRVRVQCSQICGVGHADMQAPVQVVSLDDFNSWIDKTRKAQESDMGGMNMGGMKMDGGGGMNMNGGQMDMNGDSSGSGGMQMNNGGSGMNMNNGQMNDGQMDMTNGGGSSGSGGMQMNNDGSNMNMNGRQMNDGQMDMNGSGSSGSGSMQMNNGGANMNMNGGQMDSGSGMNMGGEDSSMSGNKMNMDSTSGGMNMNDGQMNMNGGSSGSDSMQMNNDSANPKMKMNGGQMDMSGQNQEEGTK